MAGISSQLIMSLRTVLADCEQFETNRSLRNLFSDERIMPWKNNLPQTDSVMGRVESIIGYLQNKKHKDGTSALMLMLLVLADTINFDDNRHNQLTVLAADVASALGQSTPNPKTTENNNSHQISPSKADEQKEEYEKVSLIDSSSNIDTLRNTLGLEKIDFFISYNRNDKKWAEWIAWQLENASYSTIIQAWDFRPGGNFVADMQKATANSERTIAVLSPDYLASRFTQPEWNAAFALDPTGDKGLLLPVRVRECELTGLLPQIIFIDLVGLSADEATEVLLAGVKRGRAKPNTSPNFPKKTEQIKPELPK